MNGRRLLLALAASGLGCMAGTSPAFAAQSIPSFVSSCAPPRTFTTGDNDIRFEEDPRPQGAATELPAPVAKTIKTAALPMLQKLEPGMLAGRTCADIFGDAYKVALPGARDLFVATIRLGLGADYFLLMLRDRSSGAVTRQPVVIGAKWPNLFGASDPLVKRPFIFPADLFGDGHTQIVFEERTHNGTVYNAVLYHYFEIGPDLKLIRILAHEESAIFFDRTYRRGLTPVTPNRVRLDTFSTPSLQGEGGQSLGYAILERGGTGLPFKVIERHPVDQFGNGALITFSEPKSDDIFLRDGYTFYY